MKLLKVKTRVINLAHVAWATFTNDVLDVHFNVPQPGVVPNFPFDPNGPIPTGTSHVQEVFMGEEAAELWRQINEA